MAAYDTIKKVKLKDPITVGSSAAILYPVTGINAIFAGTSGDAATTYITGTGSGTQIQPQYLAIVNSNTVVDNTYLAFMDNTTGKVIDTYLNFISNGKIDPAYLPSYVDDVVEIPVVEYPDFAPHPAYSLMIQEGTDGSVKTYTFYEWSASEAKWVQGGGEQSKIYIAETASGAGDGSIYRCKSGSTTQAVKISENPYIISTDKTNGVWLDLTNSTLTAKAQVATSGAPGTVQIDTSAVTATKNVALTISNEGLLGVSVVMAGAAQAGIVFAVGTEADYVARTSAYGDASVVPTAKWTVDMIASGLAGVPLATYDAPGIVQPSLAGHIIVSSGVISVPDATVSTAGVVYLVGKVNTDITENAGKAVTQAGIVDYVGSALTDYQPSLTPGNGIEISSNGTIYVDKTGDALGFTTTDGQLFVSSATATTMGAVLITGDSSVIANGTTHIDSKPVAVNGGAVKDYVDYRFNNYTPTYAKATINGSGVVQIQPLVSATSSDSSYLVPNAWDVVSTIAGATAAVLYKVAHGLIISGGGIALTTDTEVDPNTLQIGLKLDIASTSPLYLTEETSRLAISSATSNNLGVMQVGTGLAVTAGGVVSVPMVNDAAGFDVESNASKAATVSAIADYVASAVAQGQRPITNGVGITITSGATSDEVSVNYTGAIIASGSAIAVQDASTESSGVVIMLSDVASATPAITNQVAHAYAVKTFMEGKIATLTAHSDPIYVVSASDPNSAGSLQIKDAADGQRGVVTLADDATVFGATAYASAVPTVSALTDYLTTALGDYQPTLHEGAAIDIIDGNTVGVLYNTNQMTIDPATSALTISSAIAGSFGLMAPGTGLDITAGTVYVPLVTDSASFDVASDAVKPPTVSALVGYLSDTLTAYQTTIDSGAAIQIIEGNTIAVLYDTAQMGLDSETSALTINKATSSGFGLVEVGSGLGVTGGTVYVPLVTDSASFDVSSEAGKPPTVGAVSGYITSVLTGYQTTISSGAATSVVGGTINVLYTTSQMKLTEDNQLYISSATSNVLGIVNVPKNSGLVLTDGALTAAIAGATVLGAVKIGSGISSSSDGTISVDTGVNDSAVYVTGSAATDVDLGGVRVVSSGGILVNLGNIYLDSATSAHLGGIKLAKTNTGLAMGQDNQTLAVQLDTNVMSMTEQNQITVKPATTGSAGIVQLLADASLMGSSSYAGRVPVASAVDAYVSSRIDGARTTLTEGYGINVTGTTANGAIDYEVEADVQAPIKFDGGKIAINVASAAVDGTVGGNALGAVNIYGLGIRSIEDLVDVTNKASIVPTESAVRLAINALPYITYEEVN